MTQSDAHSEMSQCSYRKYRHSWNILWCMQLKLALYSRDSPKNHIVSILHSIIGLCSNWSLKCYDQRLVQNLFKWNNKHITRPKISVFKDVEMPCCHYFVFGWIWPIPKKWFVSNSFIPQRTILVGQSICLIFWQHLSVNVYCWYGEMFCEEMEWVYLVCLEGVYSVSTLHLSEVLSHWKKFVSMVLWHKKSEFRAATQWSIPSCIITYLLIVSLRNNGNRSVIASN